jgi:hypothetical protein
MPPRSASISFFKRHGLGLTVLALLLFSLAGHLLSGWRYENAQRAEHEQPPQPLIEYARSAEFHSTVLENWESEFLQMGLFVLLAVHLRQVGSAESRPFDPRKEAAKRKTYPLKDQPWPMRRGGVWKALYERSLAIVLLAMFVLTFIAHVITSWRAHVDEQRLHGEAPTPLGDYLFDAELWFQSLQNWQSEFMAILSLVVLSIFLRQKDSPQSKQPEAPHSETGH